MSRALNSVICYSDPHVLFTALSELELGRWNSALTACSGPCIEAIIEVNELESAHSALVALILLSIVLEASFRKILIGFFIVLIPAIEGQVSDLFVGFAYAIKIFRYLGFFDLPAFRVDSEAQQRNRVYLVNAVAVVLWDIMFCCSIATQARYPMWLLVVLLVICFSTYVVVIVWVCCCKIIRCAGRDQAD
jgi:hypothetical protein